MPQFQFTAKSNIFLEGGGMIRAGERFNIGVHDVAAQKINILENKSCRQEVLRQFSNNNGIDFGKNGERLRRGNWDIKEMPVFKSEMPSHPEFKEISERWKDLGSNKEAINDVEMKKGCIDTVSKYYQDGFQDIYQEGTVMERYLLVESFYEDIQKEMGIDAKLKFEHMPSRCKGEYSPVTNTIKLNSKFLERDSFYGVAKTLLHESRHAFQQKCIDNPDSVTVDRKVIDSWKYNMSHYISPETDYMAYKNQAVEKDANNYAETVINKGIDKACA